MEIRSILVLFQGRSHESVVRAACKLAMLHDAAVVGLHVVDLLPVAMADGADLSGRIYEAQREQLLAGAAQAQDLFQSLSETTGVRSEWRCEEGSTLDITNAHARHSDLLCLSGGDSRVHPDAGAPVREDLLFTTGRPVLVVPAGYAGGAIGEDVAVAWDASRESARAVADAMGILKKASSVSVVTVADGSLSDRESGVAELDVSMYLAQHGVRAQAATTQRGGMPVAEALHSWVAEHGQDLLVMGAYGQSRFREMMLGGTTRWMMRHTEVPLFMSH